MSKKRNQRNTKSWKKTNNKPKESSINSKELQISILKEGYKAIERYSKTLTTYQILEIHKQFKKVYGQDLRVSSDEAHLLYESLLPPEQLQLIHIVQNNDEAKYQELLEKYKQNKDKPIILSEEEDNNNV